MSEVPEADQRADGSTVPTLRDDEVPSGNLFATPELTALDPADKDERRSVERLLESLDSASR